MVAKLPDTFLSRIRRFRDQETAGGAAGQENFAESGGDFRGRRPEVRGRVENEWISG